MKASRSELRLPVVHKPTARQPRFKLTGYSDWLAKGDAPSMAPELAAVRMRPSVSLPAITKTGDATRAAVAVPENHVTHTDASSQGAPPRRVAADSHHDALAPPPRRKTNVLPPASLGAGTRLELERQIMPDSPPPRPAAPVPKSVVNVHVNSGIALEAHGMTVRRKSIHVPLGLAYQEEGPYREAVRRASITLDPGALAQVADAAGLPNANATPPPARPRRPSVTKIKPPPVASREDLIPFLRRVPWFEGLSDDELRMVAKAGRFERKARYRTIIRQGMFGSHFYVLISGMVQCKAYARARPHPRGHTRARGPYPPHQPSTW